MGYTVFATIALIACFFAAYAKPDFIMDQVRRELGE